MKYLLSSFLIFLLSSTYVYCQSRFEIYAGTGYSNIIRYESSAQKINAIPFLAPNFKFTYHGGLNYEFFRTKIINFKIGIGYFERGSYDIAIISPGQLVAPELAYIRFPLTINYKLLKDKKFFVSGGLTPGYLVKNYSKTLNFPFYIGAYKFQLDYEIGLLIPVWKHFSTKINLTKGIFSLDDPYFGYVNVQKTEQGGKRNINFSYDFSLIYKF